MAVTIDSAGSATAVVGGTTNTQTIAHTCSGTERLIVLRAGYWAAAAGDAISSVAYNGVALTKIADSGRSSGGDNAQIWILVAPATGANNLVITWGSTSGTNRAGTLQITSYNGVDQSTPTGTAATGTGSGTSVSVNVSGASGDYVIDVIAWDAGTATASLPGGSGQTSNFNAVSNGEGGAGSNEPGAASVTMSWTLSVSTTWSQSGIALKPTGGVVTPTGYMTTNTGWWGT